MKQRIFTNFSEYVEHLIANQNTLLTIPVKEPVEIFVFKEDFRFEKITEDQVQQQTNTVFKLKDHTWYYWDDEELEFIEVNEYQMIEKLLKPMYDKWHKEHNKINETGTL